MSKYAYYFVHLSNLVDLDLERCQCLHIILCVEIIW